MILSQRRPEDPTPEEIQERAAEIRRLHLEMKRKEKLPARAKYQKEPGIKVISMQGLWSSGIDSEFDIESLSYHEKPEY